ncbi:hypothetical protein, partial [Planktothricoides sp. SR001]|uniref:hypothetical protein n=1 Tax=Planktothricoides sp. SR001 TaxID=1705388 RepID=UPI001E522E09
RRPYIFTTETRFLCLGTKKPGFFLGSTVGANALVAPTYSPQKPGFFAWGLRNRVSFSPPTDSCNFHRRNPVSGLSGRLDKEIARCNAAQTR